MGRNSATLATLQVLKKCFAPWVIKSEMVASSVFMFAPILFAPRTPAPTLDIVETQSILTNPRVAKTARYICIGPSCAPIGDFFDAPISARRKFRRTLASSRRLRRLKPGWAQLFAQDIRLKMSNMSPTAITTLGAIVNVLLAVFKLVVGRLAGSAALIADGWHSFGESRCFHRLTHRALSMPRPALHQLNQTRTHALALCRYHMQATLSRTSSAGSFTRLAPDLPMPGTRKASPR